MPRYILFDWGGTLGRSGHRNEFIYGSRRQKQAAIFPDTIRTLQYLHARGYKLGLVSNTKHDAYDMQLALIAMGIRHLFSCLIYSNDDGMCDKPCTRIYATAKRCLERHVGHPIKYSEILFVGNNYAKDIIAPKRLGMHTAFFVHPEKPDPAYMYLTRIHNGYHDVLLNKIGDLMQYL